VVGEANADAAVHENGVDADDGEDGEENDDVGDAVRADVRPSAARLLRRCCI